MTSRHFNMYLINSNIKKLVIITESVKTVAKWHKNISI